MGDRNLFFISHGSLFKTKKKVYIVKMSIFDSVYVRSIVLNYIITGRSGPMLGRTGPRLGRTGPGPGEEWTNCLTNQ